jgi:curved DNA-binding protein CbpA
MSERPELLEDVELEMEHRKYLLDVHDRLATITHYELLGVPRTADKKAIKVAYFRITGSVHPDRFFKKRLGSYRAKMEAIFSRLEDAYRTLTSKEDRAKYDATLGAAPAPSAAPGAPAAAAAASPVDPKLAAKRREAMEALKSHLDAARANAKRHADEAARAKAAGDFASAVDHYAKAVMYAPNDPALRAAHAEMQAQAGAKLAESHAKKAALEERFGRWAAAADSWRKVLASAPDDRQARERLANALARAGRGP